MEPRYFTVEQIAIILQRNSSEGNPTAKLLGLVDGTVLQISRPKINQNVT